MYFKIIIPLAKILILSQLKDAIYSVNLYTVYSRTV